MGSLSFPVGGVSVRLASAPQPARCRAAFARRPPTSPRRESIDGQGQQQPEERQEEQEAEAGEAQGRAEEVIAAASCLAFGRQWIGWTGATDGQAHRQPTLRPASRQRGAGRRRRWGAPAVAVGGGRRPSPSVGGRRPSPSDGVAWDQAARRRWAIFFRRAIQPAAVRPATAITQVDGSGTTSSLPVSSSKRRYCSVVPYVDTHSSGPRR